MFLWPQNRQEKFSVDNRLKKESDFRFVRKHGEFFYKPHCFVWVFKPNDETISRFGVATKKGIGHAPKRNQVKRWLRDHIRKTWLKTDHVFWAVVSVSKPVERNDLIRELDEALAGALG